MNTQKLLIAAALSACSCSVFAQWQWVDETGRKVFSDRPPPAQISQKQILKQPHGTPSAKEKVLYPTTENTAPAAVAPAPVAAPAPAAPPAPAAAPTKEEEQAAARDKAAEEAKQKAEEAERKKQEAQQAKARQENCQRARAAQATLQSGGLVAHVNEKGERGLMTEEQRQSDLQRTQKIIKDSCK